MRNLSECVPPPGRYGALISEDNRRAFRESLAQLRQELEREQQQSQCSPSTPVPSNGMNTGNQSGLFSIYHSSKQNVSDSVNIDVIWIIAGVGMLVLLLGTFVLWKLLRRRKKPLHPIPKQSRYSASISVIHHIADCSNSEMSCGGTRALNIGVRDDFVRESTSSTTAPTKAWKLIEALGRGRYGSVYLAIDLVQNSINRDLPSIYAMKRAMFSAGIHGERVQNKETRSISDEMAILVNLDHDHIVKFYGSALCKRSIVLFLEYCPLGDLSNTVREYGAFDFVTTRLLLQQLLSAIKYLHSMDIVHRDIKGRNILLSLDENPGSSKRLTLKLADFGCSIKTTHSGRRHFGGTVHWMAPEVIQGTHRDNNLLWALDIWSLGITIIEMVTTRPVLSRTRPPKFARVIKYDLQQFMNGIPVMDNDALDNLIQKCLTIDPQQRPTAKELLQNDAFITSKEQSKDPSSAGFESNRLIKELEKKWTQKMLKTEAIKRRCSKMKKWDNFVNAG